MGLRVVIGLWQKNGEKLEIRKVSWRSPNRYTKSLHVHPHNLLITKWSVSGLDRKSLTFISAYLKNREQKTKIQSTFIDLLNKLFGVSQGLILDPILFITFLSDIFMLMMQLLIICWQNYIKAFEFFEPLTINYFSNFSKTSLILFIYLFIY